MSGSVLTGILTEWQVCHTVPHGPRWTTQRAGPARARQEALQSREGCHSVSFGCLWLCYVYTWLWQTNLVLLETGHMCPWTGMLRSETQGDGLCFGGPCNDHFQIDVLMLQRAGL